MFAGSSDEGGDTDIGRSDVDDDADADAEEGMQPSSSPAQDHTGPADMLLPNNDARHPRGDDTVSSREPSPKRAVNNGATTLNSSLPSELEVRGSGLYSRLPVPRGTRYGPYLGKWMAKPLDPRFAWEVRIIYTKEYNFLM